MLEVLQKNVSSDKTWISWGVYLLHSGFYNLLYQNRVGSPGSIYTFYISKNSFFISASYLLGAVSVFMESRCVSVPFPQNQRSCAQFSAADCWFWSNFHPTSRCWNILQLEMHNIQQMETCCFCLELRFWFWREGRLQQTGLWWMPVKRFTNSLDVLLNRTHLHGRESAELQVVCDPPDRADKGSQVRVTRTITSEQNKRDPGGSAVSLLTQI